MIEIKRIQQKEFNRVCNSSIHKVGKLTLLADMCRANALATVKRSDLVTLAQALACLIL